MSIPLHPATASATAVPAINARPSDHRAFGRAWTWWGGLSALGLSALGVLSWPVPSILVAAPPSAHRAAHQSGLSQVEVERADWRAQLCSGANAVGVGLRGEYYLRSGWRGEPALVRTDATLEFDSRLDWPSEQTAPARSARWSGWVRAPLTGRFRFHAEPRSVVVEVAGQRLAGPGSAADSPIELAAGRFYPITVAWDAIDAAAGPLRLQWTAPHGARFTIPRNALFLPTESVVVRR